MSTLLDDLDQLVALQKAATSLTKHTTVLRRATAVGVAVLLADCAALLVLVTTGASAVALYWLLGVLGATMLALMGLYHWARRTLPAAVASQRDLTIEAFV